MDGWDSYMWFSRYTSWRYATIEVVLYVLAVYIIEIIKGLHTALASGPPNGVLSPCCFSFYCETPKLSELILNTTVKGIPLFFSFSFIHPSFFFSFPFKLDTPPYLVPDPIWGTGNHPLKNLPFALLLYLRGINLPRCFPIISEKQ